MEHSHLPQGDLLMDEVDVNLDVLRAAVVDMVGYHIDSTNVVALDDRRRRKRDVELLAKPTALGDHVCHCHPHGTRPQHWSERLWSGASRTRRPGCRRGRCRSRRCSAGSQDNWPSMR